MYISCVFSVIIYYATCLVLASGNRIDDLENQVKAALQKANSFVRNTKNTELVGINLQEEGKDYGTFDFIIVGSGAAGSALANRLTESKNSTVLLLEAGGDPNDELLRIPYFTDLSTFSKENVWTYLTTPQKDACLAYNNRQCSYNLGKILGGNTKTWYPLNSRGDPKAFDDLESLGNENWSYKDVLPYFQRLENFTINHDARYHGFSGPVPVSLIKPEEPVEELAVLAWTENGGIINPDYTGASALGTGRIQYLTRQGKKVAGGEGYIHPIINRPNLHLSFKSLAVKILTDRRTKAATGVKFVKDGKVYFAKSRKEVLVCAGSTNSVQLLWLSGIGPKEDLEKLHIPVVKNLPVGSHVKDFVRYDMYQTGDFVQKDTNLKELLAEYQKGEGVLTTVHNYRSRILLNVSRSNNRSGFVVLLWAPPTGLPDSISNSDNGNSSIKKRSFDFTHTFRFSFVLIPESQGTIKLKSNSPVDFPEINPNLFSKSEDSEAIFEAVQVMVKFLNTSIVRPYKTRILTAFPEENKYKFGSKQYWKRDIQLGAVPLTRAFGSTKMGPRTDLQSVVDSSLRVYDVPNLRVVGRGVLPLAIGSSSTIGYMIGEKTADIIKDELELWN